MNTNLGSGAAPLSGLLFQEMNRHLLTNSNDPENWCEYLRAHTFQCTSLLHIHVLYYDSYIECTTTPAPLSDTQPSVHTLWLKRLLRGYKVEIALDEEDRLKESTFAQRSALLLIGDIEQSKWCQGESPLVFCGIKARHYSTKHSALSSPCSHQGAFL